MNSAEPLRAAVTETPLGRPAILSPAFIAEGVFVHLSGQGPLVDGAYSPATVEEETALTLDNLETVLAASGSSLANVVRAGVYLADIADFEAMNRVWLERFAEPRPARTPIQAGALPGGIKVEIDCVALLAAEWRDRLRGTARAGTVADFASIRDAAA